MGVEMEISQIATATSRPIWKKTNKNQSINLMVQFGGTNNQKKKKGGGVEGWETRGIGADISWVLQRLDLVYQSPQSEGSL